MAEEGAIDLEAIRQRSKQRREVLDEEMASVAGAGSRKRKPLHDTNVTDGDDNKVANAGIVKRPSKESDQKTAAGSVCDSPRRSLYPLADLETMAKEALKSGDNNDVYVPQARSISNPPLEVIMSSPTKTDAESGDGGDLAEKAAVTPAARKARFAQRFADLDQFEVEQKPTAERSTAVAKPQPKSSPWATPRVSTSSPTAKSKTASSSETMIAAATTTPGKEEASDLVIVRKDKCESARMGLKTSETSSTGSGDFGMFSAFVKRKEEDEQTVSQLTTEAASQAIVKAVPRTTVKEPSVTPNSVLQPATVRADDTPTKVRAALVAGSAEQQSSVFALANKWEKMIEKSQVASAAYRSAKQPTFEPLPQIPRTPHTKSQIKAGFAAGGVSKIAGHVGPRGGAEAVMDTTPHNVNEVRKRWEKATAGHCDVSSKLSLANDDIETAASRLATGTLTPAPVSHKIKEALRSAEEQQPALSQLSTPNIASKAPTGTIMPSADIHSVEPAKIGSEARSSSELEDDGSIDSDEANDLFDEAFESVLQTKREPAPVVNLPMRNVAAKQQTLSDSAAPLITHSLSFYRNEQKEKRKSSAPNRAVVKPTSDDVITSAPVASVRKSPSKARRELQALKGKMEAFNGEVNRQQNIISQLSRYLSVCKSTNEFRGSQEEVEAERHLLLAVQKRQALLDELDRLGKLVLAGKAVSSKASLNEPSGSLIIGEIMITLKRDFVNQIVNGNEMVVHHYLCLLQHRELVVATELISTDAPDVYQTGYVKFPNHITLPNLPPDFNVRLEVYSMQTKREPIAHEVKYHIKTPKGKEKSVVNLFSPASVNLGAPGGVRMSSFVLIGHLMLGMSNVAKKRLMLSDVQYSATIESHVVLNTQCHAETIPVEYRGFLNIYQEVTGYGDWRRLWCVLNGTTILCWKYPDEVHEKKPQCAIELINCVTRTVALADKEVCARANTLLLEVKAGQDGELRNLFLSCDSKEDAMMWADQLTASLQGVAAWTTKT